MHITSHSVLDTIKLGSAIARHLKPGDIICLSGQLGAGKTVLVKGIARGIGVKPDDVVSPTFVLMRQYRGRLTLNHLDLYRLDAAQQMFDVGYEDYLYTDAVVVIEWPQRLSYLAPKECLNIEISAGVGEADRSITLRPHGARYEELISRL